jgi:DNA-binding CsgD family transcriptional regulator
MPNWEDVVMQALIATLDAALYNSVATLLGALNPGTVTRRAYNAPELNALLEGESFTLVFFDSSMPGYGRDFSANSLASWYPQAQFFVLGGVGGLRLDSVPPHVSVPALRGGPIDAGRGTSTVADLMQAVDLSQRGGQPDGPSLTGRQLEVLRLVREGKSTKEIARHLDLAVPTVKTHLAALYRQLGVRNRVEAAMAQATAALQPARRLMSQRPAVPVLSGHLRAVG